MASSRGAPSIVLVEDDADLLAALTFALQVDGFEVHAYADAETVLAAQGAIPADCYVLDVRLPGMDGLMLLDQLRERGRTAPALVITTSSPEIRRRAALAGADIVEKPLLRDILAERVKAALEPKGLD